MRVKLDGRGGYIITDGTVCTATGQNPNGRDYRRAVKWIQSGNVPEPADPEPVAELTAAEVVVLATSGEPLHPKAQQALEKLRQQARAKLR